MRIVSKRSYVFVDWAISENTSTGENVAKPLNTFRVQPSTLPQLAPDWISKDELFSIAQSDGNLTILK